MEEHRTYMRQAVKLAEEGMSAGEVPVGALIVRGDRIIASERNRTVENGAVIYHAELLAIKAACTALESNRLDGCTLYSTLEPCPMCAGAIVLSRISRLIFGASDAKAGACGTLYSITTDSRLNHMVETYGGILEKECADILTLFFEKKRGNDPTGAL